MAGPGMNFNNDRRFFDQLYRETQPLKNAMMQQQAAAAAAAAMLDRAQAGQVRPESESRIAQNRAAAYKMNQEGDMVPILGKAEVDRIYAGITDQSRRTDNDTRITTANVMSLDEGTRNQVIKNAYLEPTLKLGLDKERETNRGLKIENANAPERNRRSNELLGSQSYNARQQGDMFRRENPYFTPGSSVPQVQPKPDKMYTPTGPATSAEPEKQSMFIPMSTPGTSVEPINLGSIMGTRSPAAEVPALRRPSYAAQMTGPTNFVSMASAPPPVATSYDPGVAVSQSLAPTIRRQVASLQFDDEPSFLERSRSSIRSVFDRPSVFTLKRGTARVPGKGEGDKVPAMLEPGEAVLNKKAAGMIGRDKIAKANAKGNAARQKETASKVAALIKMMGMG